VLSLGVCFCAVWDCSSYLGDSGDPHQVVVVGTTPASLGNLTKLVELDCGSNNMTGVIPDELGN